MRILKLLLKISLLVLLVLLGISLGFVVGYRSGRHASNVAVSIMNNSSHVLKTVRLTNEQGIYLIQDIQIGQLRVIEFVSPGENSYSLQVEFDDGSQFQGGGGYVEPGYKITEEITDEGVKSKVNSLF